MATKYSECNFDGKPLHPDDKKAIEEFLEYRKKRNQKKSLKLKTKEKINPSDS